MSEKNPPDMGALFGGKAMKGLMDITLAEPGAMNNADMVVMGAPIATPYQSVGSYCADAPDAIRAAFGWPGVLEHHDFDLGGKIFVNNTSAVDWGNLACSETDFEHNRALICSSVTRVLEGDAVPIVIGGDDSTPIPVLQAYADHGPITVVQFDAHIDWRDDVGGERLGLSSNMRRASEMDWVENMIQIGARGLGSARPQDYQDAVAWGVQFFSMRDIQNLLLDDVVNSIPAGSKVFINFDVDALDPAIAPSVIGPAPGGLDYWQVVHLLTGIAKRAKIVGFALTELMPANDIGGRGLGLISRQASIH